MLGGQTGWQSEREYARRWMNGNRRAFGNPTRKTQGLTNPSSATEAGHARREIKGNPDGQPLFAGARG